jgi:glycosyltransferase involved in cell wall biosynthesis
MKLLLSAYACEPGKGSEPGVGWNWAKALARRGHAIHVVTRSNNQAVIESATDAELSLLRFSYFDLPPWARAWKHLPGALYFYYLLWQIGAYRLAKRLHAQEKFDCVHHVTFVAYRQPSFMGGLGIPFIFGPVGGGESMPAAFRHGIPWSGRIKEIVRGLANVLLAWDPLMSLTFSRASLIACTTKETLDRIPIRFRNKCIVQPAIGISDSEIAASPAPPTRHSHFLFIGRLLYWKGLHLILRALPQVIQSIPNAKLKIVGKGGDRAWLAAIARQAGVGPSVEWISGMQHDQVAQAYRESLAFAFPSLHDSGGMVVLEALAAGLPVVCLDLGGPGAIVTSSCGVVIESRQQSEEAVVASLAQAMISLATDPAQRARLSQNALDRARQMTWDLAAESLYTAFEAKVSKRRP